MHETFDVTFVSQVIICMARGNYELALGWRWQQLQWQRKHRRKPWKAFTKRD